MTTYFGTMPEKIRSGSISFFRVQPRLLCFPYESKRLTSCSLYLTNSTLFYVVFSLQTENPRRYYTKLPFCGIVPPKCSYTLTVTMREQKKNATFIRHEFLTLRSSIVPGQQLKNVNADSVAAFFEEVRKMAGSSSNKRKIVCEVQEVRIPVECNPPEVSTSDQSIQSAAAEIIASPNYRQVLSIDVHPTKPWILTTNNRGNASIWNYETKETLNSLEVNITEEPVYSGKFIEQKEWLVVGGGDGYIYVYSYESSDTLEEVECFKAHDGHHIMSLAVKPTQSFVLSASDDRLIKLWDWAKGWECIQTFQGHYNNVTHVMFDPRDSNRFLSASLDRTVKIWSSDSSESNVTLHEHPDGVICLQYFSRDNRQLLIAGSSDGTAKIWDLETESSVGVIEGDGEQLNALFLHPELPVLITGLHNGTVHISKSTSTTAYRLENIASFNLGAVKAVGHIKRLRRIVVACDQGLAVLEIKLLLRAGLG
ncbi:hypothetical protein ACQ4PT_009707 [Festuca glaucescens]